MMPPRLLLRRNKTLAYTQEISGIYIKNVLPVMSFFFTRLIKLFEVNLRAVFANGPGYLMTPIVYFLV